jgi:hypothetical protein
MKKVILFFLIVCATTVVKAQVYVGGSLSSWFNETNSTETTTVRFLPEVGYSVSDRWAFGGVLGFTRKEVNDKTTTKTVEFSPYARFSFYRSELVHLFVEGGFTAYSSKVGSADAETTFSMGFRPGVSLDLSRNVSLVAKFGFLGYRDYGDEDAYGFLLDGNGLSFGVFYSF